VDAGDRIPGLGAVQGAEVKYRKLPGARRGFLHGASLWMGDDHILAVKSLRFREEYKRFYLRDIQAIVMAKRPRFLVSTRAAVAGAVWLVALIAVWNRATWAPATMSVVGVLLLASWLYCSMAASCSCRIYTAVSRDELPSIYRTWTARQFLAEVEPGIWKVQGVLQGNWAEAVEERAVGPRLASAPAAGRVSTGTPRLGSRRYTAASAIFVASLFTEATLIFFTLHSLTRRIEWIGSVLAIVQIGAAILMFVEHHRGILQRAMQRLAIVTLILSGAVYYVRQILAGAASGGRLPDPAMLTNLPSYLVLREVDAGVCLILGMVGAALMLMSGSERV
jgi:hypothetical protein